MDGEGPGAILRTVARQRREAGEAILRELAAHRDSGFTGFLEQRARAWRDRPALRHGERTHSYAQLFEAIARVQAILRAKGIGERDPVGVLLENTDRYVIWYLAVLGMGAIAVPINPKLAAPEMHYILGNARVVLTLSEGSFAQRLAEIDALAGAEVPRLLIDDAQPTGEAPAPAATATPAGIAQDTPAAVYYTSGTTGSPKGVVHTHGSLIAIALQSPEPWGYDIAELRALAITPLFHIALHTIFLPVLALGGLLVVDAYATEDTIRSIERNRINSFFGVPSILLMMVEKARELGVTLPGVRALQFGAAPMPVARLDDVRSLFVNAELVHGMGQTESAGTIVTLPSRLAFERAGSVGFAIPGMEIDIVGEADEPLPPLLVGELVARGPNVMKEYLRNPAATAETLRGGWLHTGDLGYRDADGFVYLVDRKKDMIIRGGENIYSSEVEQVLMRHPALESVAVVGRADPLFGERVVAFLVPRPGATAPTLEEIQAHCRPLMAGYKAPAEVLVLEQMPVTATGKIRKGELRALLTDG